MDATLLARLQFAFTVSFHIIFPATSIGLSVLLAIFEGLYLWTKDAIYLQIYKFWLRIFAMAFGVGVVTGIVLSFEFGLGFAGFSRFAGGVLGPMIGLEVLTSFFLEAGFLGIMLFGMNRVGPKLHFLATCLVSVGTLISSAWILSANSWMQHPVGVDWQNGHLVVTDWLAVVFNPAWQVRWPHMAIAAGLTGSFFVCGVSAYYLLRRRHLQFAKRSLSVALTLATVLIATQVLVGDILAGKMGQFQPAKMQAAEGYWDKTTPSPTAYLWFVVPDQQHQRNHVQIGTPVLGSIWLTHSLDGQFHGLQNTQPENQPPMAWVFYGFRTMFIIALLMFSAGFVGLYLRLTKKVYTTRWYLKWLVWMTPSGVFATLGGWYTAEIGRQPFVVYGMLRTADAVSPVPAQVLLTTFALFVSVYSVFLTSFLVYVLRVISSGPSELDVDLVPTGSLHAGLRDQLASGGE